MEYEYPEYYKQFHCIADKCENSCCEGWQIVIDPWTMKKYEETQGVLHRILEKNIEHDSSSFKQRCGKCAFLNEKKLCDLYIMGGEEMFCKTCRRYPRHYEEYENFREITLSMSCPEAARLIFSQKEQMKTLRSERDMPEETYEYFDCLLFSVLCDVRQKILDVNANKDFSMEYKMAYALAFVHDVENRVKDKHVFDVYDMLKYMERPKAYEMVKRKLAAYCGYQNKSFQLKHRMFHNLYRMEHLQPDWEIYLRKIEKTLYYQGAEYYKKIDEEFRNMGGDKLCQMQQMFEYFIYVYFAGAVYDEKLLHKVKFAAFHTLMMRELCMAEWLENGRRFTWEDLIRITSRYAREIEHSDVNLERLERILEGRRECRLKNFFYCLLGTSSFKVEK